MACSGPELEVDEEEDDEVETFTVFEGKPEELGKFLDEHKPSDPAWNTENTRWVSVHNAKGFEYGELDKAFVMWQDLERSRRVTAQRIEEIALAAKLTVGKWVIFRHRRVIDETWKMIAEATEAGKLGCSAKVATVYESDATCNKQNKEAGQHVICVYTENFANKDDVWRVEKVLRSMGFTDILKYKPDIYTWFKIYVGNKYKIEPSLYTSRPDD